MMDDHHYIWYFLMVLNVINHLYRELICKTPWLYAHFAFAMLQMFATKFHLAAPGY